MHMAKKRSTTGNPWPALLKKLRADLDEMTQKDAAERVGVSTRAWIKWEMGDQIPSPSHQILIKLLAEEKI